MGQWFTLPTTSDVSTPNPKKNDSKMSTPKTPQTAPINFDPRSPTSEYNRTPILINRAKSSQSDSQPINDENSPDVVAIQTTPAVRPRTMHQRIFDRKFNEQDNS